MKILENTLKVKLGRWDDPGDYPSNAGSGPLPSHDYVEEIEGHVLLKIENVGDLSEFREGIAYLVDLPEDNLWLSWNIELLPDWTVKLTVTDFDS